MRKLIFLLPILIFYLGTIVLLSTEANAQKDSRSKRSSIDSAKVSTSPKGRLGIAGGPSGIQCNPAGTITVGGSAISGSLGTGDCQFEDGTFFDLYTLTGTAGERVTVSMTSTAVDSYLILFDSAGEILLEDDDGLGESNARIPFEQGVIVLPYTGTYYIGTNSYDVASGAYQVVASRPSECATNTPITPGATVTAALTTSDCRTSLDGTLFYTKFYSFSGTSGQQLSFGLTATSGNLDPYLVLRTPSGAGTVEDDNGGGGTAARIPAGTGFFSLPETGTYILEVSSAGESETGGFSLAINQNCNFSLSPSSPQTFGSAGGTGSLSITTTQVCSWAAQSNASWITVTSGSSGSGNGTVNFSVAANTGAARSGTMTIAGSTFSINQDAGAVGSITGTVRYYFGTSPLAVPGVSLSATGAQNVSSSSGSNGAFSLTGFGSGAYTLTPSKTGQVAGISSLDASRVAQYSAALITLTPDQILAADVTNNGSVNSLDAARIAQWIVGAASSGTNVTGTWRFTPSTRTYSSVTESLTGQDFTAILMGDVTGNWSPVSSISLASQESVIILQAIGNISLEKPISSEDTRSIRSRWAESVADKKSSDEVIEIPITVNGALDLLSYDAVISFDEETLEPVLEAPVRAIGSLSTNFNLVINRSEPGKMRIAAYGIVPVVGDGDLLYLRFRVRKSGEATISFDSLILNEQVRIASRVRVPGPDRKKE